jgi:hypothetical protein
MSRDANGLTGIVELRLYLMWLAPVKAVQCQSMTSGGVINSPFCLSKRLLFLYKGGEKELMDSDPSNKRIVKGKTKYREGSAFLLL